MFVIHVLLGYLHETFKQKEKVWNRCVYICGFELDLRHGSTFVVLTEMVIKVDVTSCAFVDNAPTFQRTLLLPRSRGKIYLPLY